MDGRYALRAKSQLARQRPVCHPPGMSRSAETLAVDRWALQLAPGWEAELEGGCACVTKLDGVGVLLISHADKVKEPVTRDELQQIADGELPGDADVGPCRMGVFEGLHATYAADGARWHRFYLGYGTLLLLISYTVELADDGTEDDEVIGMLRTLSAHGDRWE
jgi:hypothetical protein